VHLTLKGRERKFAGEPWYAIIILDHGVRKLVGNPYPTLLEGDGSSVVGFCASETGEN